MSHKSSYSSLAQLSGDFLSHDSKNKKIISHFIISMFIYFNNIIISFQREVKPSFFSL